MDNLVDDLWEEFDDNLLLINTLKNELALIKNRNLELLKQLRELENESTD